MRKLMYTVETVTNGALLVTNKVYPELQYAFESASSFYNWLRAQMVEAEKK